MDKCNYNCVFNMHGILLKDLQWRYPQSSRWETFCLISRLYIEETPTERLC